MLAAFSSAVVTFSEPRAILEPAVKPYNASTSSWVVHSKPAPEAVISLTVALTIEDESRAALEKTLYAVSDPKNADYGNHRTHAQIKALLAVPDEQVARVKEYFKYAGARAVEVNPTGDTLTVAISVLNAEAALSTTLQTFSHKVKEDLRIVRASSTYSLPAAIAKDILIVGELHQFPAPRMLKLDYGTAYGTDEKAPDAWPNACDASGCAGLVTPAVLKERYSVTKSDPVKGNSMAVSEFQGQYYKVSDNKMFGDSCKVPGGVTVATQIGGEKQSAGVESELDIQYIKGIADEIPLTVVYNEQYSLLDWTNQVTSLANTPHVHSVSYGNDEAQQTSAEYMKSCNTAFMKAGTLGLSILFASGDQGVCGREGCGIFKTKFKPDFPGGSPYVTVVGGTDFVTKSVIGDEMAWKDGGGGFSDTFDMPDYQKTQVAAYLANADAKLPSSSYYNAKGRAYPDVAALAGQQNSYCVATSGRFSGVAGTSAACPVVSGIFAKLNGVRLAKGGKPLGFLNPFIYQNGGAFNDVTQGKITGNMKGNGFTAVKGWDAATGFGTPNYTALAKLV